MRVALSAGCVAGGLRSVVAAAAEESQLKQWDLEGGCLQLLRGFVVDGWSSAFRAVSRRRCSNAPPMGEAELVSGGC